MSENNQYEIVRKFSENLDVFKDNETYNYGLMDKDGNIVLDSDYDSIGDLSYGAAVVRRLDENHKEFCSLIDAGGNMLTEYEYDDIGTMNEGVTYFAEEINGKFSYGEFLYGVLNNKGEEIIIATYDFIGEFENGSATFSKDGEFGIMDKDGEVIREIKCDEIGSFKNGLAEFKVNGKKGMVNTRGEIKFQPIYDEIAQICYDKKDSSYVLKNLYEVKIDSNYGWMNKDGEVIIPAECNRIYNFYEGAVYAAEDCVSRDLYKVASTMLYDYEGNKLLLNKCSRVKMEEDYVLLTTKQGLRRKDENLFKEIKKIEKKFVVAKVIKEKYTNFIKVKKNLFLAKINKKYIFTDIYGNNVLGKEYDKVSKTKNGNFKVYIEGKCGLVSSEGVELCEVKYDSISNFTNGKAKTMLDGKAGLIREDGSELVENKYDYIYVFVNGYAKVENAGKFGLIDESGKEVVPVIYDEVHLTNDEIRLVKNGKEEVIEISELTKDKTEETTIEK